MMIAIISRLRTIRIAISMMVVVVVVVPIRIAMVVVVVVVVVVVTIVAIVHGSLVPPMGLGGVVVAVIALLVLLVLPEAPILVALTFVSLMMREIRSVAVGCISELSGLVCCDGRLSLVLLGGLPSADLVLLLASCRILVDTCHGSRLYGAYDVLQLLHGRWMKGSCWLVVVVVMVIPWVVRDIPPVS